MKLLAEGAEASIYLDGNIIKQRHKKGYRIKALDEKLRLARTRREAKILERLKGKVAVPKIISVDEKKTTLEIEFIEGKKVKDVINRDYVVLIAGSKG